MSILDEQALIAQYRPWLIRVARNLLADGRRRHIEDLAQEGWIAMWRALRDHDGGAPLDFFLKMVAVRRMKTVISSMLVAERGGRQGAKVTETKLILGGNPSTDVTAEDADPVWLSLTVDLGQVELAYHHGEIAQAMASLTPKEREYVYLRFWCGYDQPAMVEHFGYVPRAIWSRAKTKLIEHLGHLATVG